MYVVFIFLLASFYSIFDASQGVSLSPTERDVIWANFKVVYNNPEYIIYNFWCIKCFFFVCYRLNSQKPMLVPLMNQHEGESLMIDFL